MRILLQLGLALLATVAMIGAAQAGEPHDAGFKARGMKDASPRPRVYYYRSPAPVTGRQSFSYAPSGDVTAAPAPASAAPARANTNSYRTYSYSAAPVQTYRSYRSGRWHSGLSGDYGSKATLYK
jgi:hypothetical protein